MITLTRRAVSALALTLGLLGLCIVSGLPAATAAGAAGATAAPSTAKVLGPTITLPATVSASNWTVATPPSGVDQAVLLADSCTSASFCVAVGQQGTGPSPLIEQWNGTTWTVVSSPTLSGSAAFAAVSCASSTFCVAVGGVQSSTLVEMWNGTAWSVATSPNTSGASSTYLEGVSCLGASSCKAVGQAYFGSSQYTPVALTFDGTNWTSDTMPNPSGGGIFNAVSCTVSMCMAVGSGGGGETGLTEQWNGTSWAIVTSPDPTGQTSVGFRGVSCVGPDATPSSRGPAPFCMLVGQGYDGTVYQTLFERWDGSTWTIVPSPNAGTDSNHLQAIDCFSATSCSAVGYSTPPAGSANESLTWDGTTWSLQTTPDQQGATDTELNGVSCVTDWQCVAVGFGVSGTTSAFIITAPISRTGYRFVASDGGIFAYGNGAPFLGSMGGQPLNKPIVGMAVMPAGDGYYLVASDGGIFSFGSAKFYGSAGGSKLNAPIVGMALTADGAGYWLVASDGGVFSYGDATFYGSAGSLHLNKPIVGMAATPNGLGYYLVASDGGIFTYSDAVFSGSAGGTPLNQPIVGMAAPVGGGYYLVASDGGIFSYPTTAGPPFYGSTGSIKLNKPIVGMTAVAGGYYLSGSDGGVFTFPTTNGPTFYGSTGSITLNQPIVGISG